MSKSDSSDYSRINLTDDADTVKLKVQKAKTDPHPLPDSLDGLKHRPEADNLLGIYAALADKTLEATVAEFAGWQFSKFKAVLTDVAVATMGRIGAEMKRLMADPAEIDRLLKRGSERAGAMAGRHLR